MSDDEEDEEEEIETAAEVREEGQMETDVPTELLSVLNEEEGLVIPHSGHASKRSSASARRGRTASPKEVKPSSLGSKRDSETRTSSTPSSKRSRRSTLESLFAPLSNFIDFREDESARSWRSFVEVSS